MHQRHGLNESLPFTSKMDFAKMQVPPLQTPNSAKSPGIAFAITCHRISATFLNRTNPTMVWPCGGQSFPHHLCNRSRGIRFLHWQPAVLVSPQRLSAGVSTPLKANARRRTYGWAHGTFFAEAYWLGGQSQLLQLGRNRNRWMT